MAELGNGAFSNLERGRQVNRVHLGVATKILIGAALAMAVLGCAERSLQRASGSGADMGEKHAVGAAPAAPSAATGNVWSSKMEEQKRTMEHATLGTGVQVSQTIDHRLKLEIPSDISFDTNRADIKPNFRPVLDRFATTLNNNPAATVTIIGHTDQSGSDAVNQPLSMERAAHTRDYLATQGVTASRIVVEGRGASEPLTSNDDNAGRARNRRVEIYVAEAAPPR